MVIDLGRRTVVCGALLVSAQLLFSQVAVAQETLKLAVGQRGN